MFPCAVYECEFHSHVVSIVILTIRFADKGFDVTPQTNGGFTHATVM